MASDSTLVEPEYGLHPYQRQVYRDILSALERPERRVVAHLPTGAGKTRIATHVAAHMLNARDDNNALVIWLASSEELCEQAAEAIERAWFRLGQRDAAVHRYWGSHQLDFQQMSDGFLVAGLAKLWATTSKEITLLPQLAHRTAGVIFDEAHQAIAYTYEFLAAQLTSARSPLLGLTATPGRTANVTAEDYRLAEMFAHQKVSIDPRGHGSAVTYLIHSKYLAEPTFTKKEFDSGVDVTEPSAGEDYSRVVLETLGHDEQRNKRIVEWTQEAALQHRRIIVFCPSVGSAIECARRLRQAGIESSAITANTPPENRQAVIERYRAVGAETRVVFNYGVLTAGFDAPMTSCVIIARPTTSLVLYSQMAGRAMRGPRVGGNVWANILTVVDLDLPGFGSVADAFNNWEELWTTN